MGKPPTKVTEPVPVSVNESSLVVVCASASVRFTKWTPVVMQMVLLSRFCEIVERAQVAPVTVGAATLAHVPDKVPDAAVHVNAEVHVFRVGIPPSHAPAVTGAAVAVVVAPQVPGPEHVNELV